ncbi:MAG: IS701 family transposase [Myxococcaceae bacterium]|nr:IS701 family transposase [Myxococcaceae bacterium]
MTGYAMGSAAQGRLAGFFERIGEVLANRKRRASFATYALGLLAEGERKSVEPIAAKVASSPEEVDALHQRLLHFLVDAPWDDAAVREEAARYAADAMTAEEPVEAWIVDDTGFLKQGKHSVGVARQYTGSAGKVTNCQVATSLVLATRTQALPVDFELYLPKDWAYDMPRRKEARIPDEVGFATKGQLALGMMRRAVAAGLPKGVVLADAAYPNSTSWRAQVRALGLQYAVGIEGGTTLHRVDARGEPAGLAMSARDVGLMLGRGAFRNVTWREGTRGEMTGRFARVRVLPAHRGTRGPREEVWLLLEWPEAEAAPTKFWLASLPTTTSLNALVRLVMQRWRTEQVYEEMKGELGLDHYEGRRFPGWHHHVSVALCCYAFVIAERSRHFPPSGTWAGEAAAHAGAS